MVQQGAGLKLLLLVNTSTMRGFKRYSWLLLSSTLCLGWLFGCHYFLSGVEVFNEADKGCNHAITTGNLSSHYAGLSKRPLLVRFKWYSRKKTPIHLGYGQISFACDKVAFAVLTPYQRNFVYCRYGGNTAMAILGPYGFKETTSDDWVRRGGRKGGGEGFK